MKKKTIIIVALALVIAIIAIIAIARIPKVQTTVKRR